MYDNNIGGRSLIAYNFLGEYVNSLAKDELKFAIDSIGLNDLLDEINNTASEHNMTVEDTVYYIKDTILEFIKMYDNLEIRLTTLSPVFDNIVLIDLGEIIDGEMTYSVYNLDGELSDAIKKNIHNIVQSAISKDYVPNSHLIIIFIDIIQYGESICKLYFNDI